MDEAAVTVVPIKARGDLIEVLAAHAALIAAERGSAKSLAALAQRASPAASPHGRSRRQTARGGGRGTPLGQ